MKPGDGSGDDAVRRKERPEEETPRNASVCAVQRRVRHLRDLELMFNFVSHVLQVEDLGIEA